MHKIACQDQIIPLFYFFKISVFTLVPIEHL